MNAFKVKYAVLDPHIIFNECGPQSAGPRGWSPEKCEKRKAAATKWIATMNRKNGFYAKLEASILKEGFRNPILVVAGWCRENKLINFPPEMRENLKDLLWCGTNGGSRLWVAQKHNLPIPCIISDFVDRFPEALILKDEKELWPYYKDKPNRITININGVAVKDIPQVHLEIEL